jgi:hypothetical protein
MQCSMSDISHRRVTGAAVEFLTPVHKIRGEVLRKDLHLTGIKYPAQSKRSEFHTRQTSLGSQGAPRQTGGATSRAQHPYAVLSMDVN